MVYGQCGPLDSEGKRQACFKKAWLGVTRRYAEGGRHVRIDERSGVDWGEELVAPEALVAE